MNFLLVAKLILRRTIGSVSETSGESAGETTRRALSGLLSDLLSDLLADLLAVEAFCVESALSGLKRARADSRGSRADSRGLRAGAIGRKKKELSIFTFVYSCAVFSFILECSSSAIRLFSTYSLYACDDANLKAHRSLSLAPFHGHKALYAYRLFFSNTISGESHSNCFLNVIHVITTITIHT